ncbi:IucA/IucC family protein [Staphylococcus chromogenes]|uniref:Siderophore synthetase n=1 Tax=Staphylococcus chromogenes TaxID=46126 RepID=A0AAE5T0P5_STACR|nr:IucA/IucC family protein [Staphylococcus chromogenes]MBV5191393.1 siderophore synthetase [Staphylococcus chromogenes]MBW3132356.1 siderophore synthetase [Staphylococcus chromogenes]MCE4971004.1 siderophore synthetase [Staphylococcus chromogenes]MCE5004927.1 siderophore synthetase [Staphylococcus chromogenes]MDU0481405.1 IucA/IucC family protein [Staphylococcus chromogenes]
MKVTDYNFADRNIQYRVILASIKESLFPNHARISFEDKWVEIQLHQHLLYVQYSTKSAFFQIHLEGPIVYQVGQNKEEINHLERLLELLTDKFNIPFDARLIEELQHSRLGLSLTYEQFEQRKIAMHHALKITRLPEKINFISWLSHMQGNEHTSSLAYTEGMIWEGHPSHPLTKTKLPLNEADIRDYAPEFMKTVFLKIVLVHRSYLAITSMDDNDRFVGEHIIPEYNSRLKQFLEPLGCELSDYRVILVHPWQYEHVITEQFTIAIKNLNVIPTPYSISSTPTLSFRTMALDHKPYHIKLPVNVQATSAVRTVSPVTTVDGPKLSYQLQGLLNIYPSLQVAMEPYGMYVKEENDIARQFAMIVRQSPKTSDNNILQFVTAALTQENPVDEQVTVDSLIEFLYGTIDAKAIETFIQSYTKTLIPPLIAYIQTYGIALEAHQQNTIFQVNQQTQEFSFIVRDLGGSRIDIDTLVKEVPHIEITNESLIADNIEAVVAKFQHAVIQNQLGTLIDHFHHAHHMDEALLYKIVRECVARSIDDTLAHSNTLRDVLFGETVTVKALLNMRMHQRVKSYMEIELQNPIQKEV